MKQYIVVQPSPRVVLGVFSDFYKARDFALQVSPSARVEEQAFERVKPEPRPGPNTHKNFRSKVHYVGRDTYFEVFWHGGLKKFWAQYIVDGFTQVTADGPSPQQAVRNLRVKIKRKYDPVFDGVVKRLNG